MFVMYWQLLGDLSRVALTVDEDKSILRSQLETVAGDLQTAANSQLQVWILCHKQIIFLWITAAVSNS